jgi:hypothetical protein
MRGLLSGPSRPALLQLALCAVVVPLLSGCLFAHPPTPIRPTAKTLVAQDLYVWGIHYDQARVGTCRAQSAGTNTDYTVELFFSDERNIMISIRPYTGPGSYAPTPSAVNSASPVTIRYYQPPVIGFDTETQSEWGGTGSVQVDAGERSGTVAASLGRTIHGMWHCG